MQGVNLSTKKTAKVPVCQKLSKEGLELTTPSQSGIYKATMVKAEQVEEKMKNTLKTENWVLNFDVKKIGKKKI